LWCWMDMQRHECSGPGLMCVDRRVLVGMWRPRLGPRLHRTQALCGPCVSRTGFSPAVCGKRTRTELHIQDIRPRMLPSSAAPRRGASCRHPCWSFPRSAPRAHGTFYSPERGSTPDFVLCTPPFALYIVHKKFSNIGPGPRKVPRTPSRRRSVGPQSDG
jgi:hypothetical protein